MCAAYKLITITHLFISHLFFQGPEVQQTEGDSAEHLQRTEESPDIVSMIIHLSNLL